MKTVTRAQDRTGSEEIEAGELALPPSVQAALGELVNAAKDGLLPSNPQDRDQPYRTIQVRNQARSAPTAAVQIDTPRRAHA